jgi:hypothetical protein
MEVTEGNTYFSFWTKLKQRKERREIGVRSNVREGKTADGVYWKRPGRDRPRNAKIKWNEAKQQDGAVDVLRERGSVEVMKSDNAGDSRANERNLDRPEKIWIGASRCAKIAPDDSMKQSAISRRHRRYRVSGNLVSITRSERAIKKGNMSLFSPLENRNLNSRFTSGDASVIR